MPTNTTGAVAPKGAVASKFPEPTPWKPGMVKNSPSSKKKAAPKKAPKAKPILIETDKDLNKLPKIYKCSCCGKMTMAPMNRFYKNAKMKAFEANEGYGYVCIPCTQDIYESYKVEYGDEKLALFLTCMHTGHYFNELLYESLRQSGESVPIGTYFRTLNNAQWNCGTILNYILELYDKKRLFKGEKELQDKLEGNWKQEDRRNMISCIRLVGFDPFDDDVYSTNDRKYLFNTLSRYLSDDTVVEDPHKVQSILTIVKLIHQNSVLENKTATILRSTNPDYGTYRNLTESMVKIQGSINKIAAENGISVNGSGKNAKSQKTFTGIVRDMLDNGVMEAKSNVFEAKMDEAYRHVAEISHKALINELHFTSDEYAKMVAEQSEIVRSQSDKIARLEEELRLERVAMDKIKNPQKYKETAFENGELYVDTSLVDENGFVDSSVDVDAILSDKISMKVNVDGAVQEVIEEAIEVEGTVI